MPILGDARLHLTHLITSLETHSDLTAAAREALGSLPIRVQKVADGEDIARQGADSSECSLVLTGVVSRYKIIGGGRRQFLSLHFAGGMPNLQNLYLDTLDHSIAAMTKSWVAFVPHAALLTATRAHACLNDALWRDTLIDSAIFREWIANVGARRSIERMAHLFCETYLRMRVLGLADETGFELPMTQTTLGQALGISPIHVNRTLQKLRRERLIKSRGQFHAILDWDRLRDIGDFDPAYLHLRTHQAIAA